MISIAVSIDVPNLAEGIQFYSKAFGFEKISAPVPWVAVLRADGMNLCLLEKAVGTQPSPHTTGTRRYERHWTPVHPDFHVDDLKSALENAVSAGAKKEQFFENKEHGSAVFCSDPFGHGFCLIERKPPTASGVR